MGDSTRTVTAGNDEVDFLRRVLPYSLKCYVKNVGSAEEAVDYAERVHKETPSNKGIGMKCKFRAGVIRAAHNIYKDAKMTGIPLDEDGVRAQLLNMIKPLANINKRQNW